MTAREHILEFLKQQTGYVPSGKIHDYVCSNHKIKRNGSHSSLARMAYRGEVVSYGYGRHTRCKLAEKNKPGAMKLFDQLRGVRA